MINIFKKWKFEFLNIFYFIFMLIWFIKKYIKYKINLKYSLNNNLFLETVNMRNNISKITKDSKI